MSYYDDEFWCGICGGQNPTCPNCGHPGPYVPFVRRDSVHAYALHRVAMDDERYDAILTCNKDMAVIAGTGTYCAGDDLLITFAPSKRQIKASLDTVKVARLGTLQDEDAVDLGYESFRDLRGQLNTYHPGFAEPYMPVTLLGWINPEAIVEEAPDAEE